MFSRMLEAFEEVKGFLSKSLSGVLPGESESLSGFPHKQVAAVMGGILLLLGAFLFIVLGGGASENTQEKGLPVYVKVRSGMSAKEIGEELQRRGIVDSKYKFWLMAKLKDYESRFMAGNYAFRRGMDTQEVLEKLVRGEAEEYELVIPEGFTVKDIAERLGEEGIADSGEFLKLAEKFAPYSYMRASDDVKYRAEGFLFPATYKIQPDATAEEILEMMAGTFDQRLTPSMRRRAREMKLSIYELVTLASLVEKEARYDEDRPIIAQVFLKRLKLDMPLQSDATLQYLMDAPKEDVSISDTKVESPYNTYQNRGLPPGPVANPGLESIQAVLQPADTDYLYFVADREGHNYYTDNYDDHLTVVDRVR